jgi:hypothetical protein
MSVSGTGGGLQGKSERLWSSQLRPHLYSTAADPNTPKTGEQQRRAWGGDKVAPSDSVVGYGYRHAAATSIYGHAGTVYDRLTDIRGYTGTHKHRFDHEGRGLGLSGRENSYDYQWMINSIDPEQKAGAPALPMQHANRDHTSGSGKA